MGVYEFIHRSIDNTTTGIEVEKQPVSNWTGTGGFISRDEQLHTLHDSTNLDVADEIVSTLKPAFYTQDSGIKKFFDDIYVPTTDSVRSKPLTVRIAGGDKSFLYWKQDVQNGRISLPVMSINREGAQFNPAKFSPAYTYTHTIPANREGTRVRKFYRPWPCLIDYSVSLWAERKRDIEYIMQLILPRFTPLAEYVIDDGTNVGKVQLRFNNYSNTSDIDIDAEEIAKVRYDISLTAEGWLPLPEKITPAVLGRVVSLNEFSGKFLEMLDPTIGPGIIDGLDSRSL